MMRAINKLLDPVRRQIRNSIARGVLTLINDATALQRVQVRMMAFPQPDGSMGAEVSADIEVMAHYGLTSVPWPGAEAAYVSVGGVRAHGLVIAVDDRRYRLTGLETGEVALYDDLGQVVHLTRTGINVTSPFNITVTAGQTLRLAGNDVVVHAKTAFRWDVNGHGQCWYGTYVDTWQIGETAGTPHTIAPPELPTP
jgi:phage baseplate assembly protein V